MEETYVCMEMCNIFPYSEPESDSSDDESWGGVITYQ